MVDEAVGGWRAATAWDMLDAALDGNAPAALVQLDRLLLGGEVPIALLAQIGSSLRRLAAAGRASIDADRSGTAARPTCVRRSSKPASSRFCSARSSRSSAAWAATAPAISIAGCWKPTWR